jgi:vitamin B12 transporter
VDHFHAGSVPVTPLELLPPGQPRTNDYYDNKTTDQTGVTPSRI